MKWRNRYTEHSEPTESQSWRSEQLSNQLKSDYSDIIPLHSKVSMVVNLKYFSLRIMKIVLSIVKTLLNKEKTQAGISGRLLPMAKLIKKATDIELISMRISKLHTFLMTCSLLFYHPGEHQVNSRKDITAVYRENTPKDFSCSIKWTLNFLLLHY